nr:hypothetical protein [Clostridia bacterium]
DRYGWIGTAKQIYPTAWIAGGALSIDKDEDDIPYYSMDSEHMLNVLARAYEISFGADFWFKNSSMFDDIIDPPIFASGNSLFTLTRFGQLFSGYYRGIDFEYGIIPFPKYDEAQEDHFIRVECGIIYFVPVTESDPEFAGAIFEAMSCAASKYVVPSYYEVSLKTKYTRDSEAVKMLDYMMQHRVYDLGDTIYSDKLRDGFVVGIALGGNPITASAIETNRGIVEGAIDKIVEGFLYR